VHRRRKKRIHGTTSVLKIDKDCFVDPALNMEYVRTILHICRRYAIKVLWIRCSTSRHGIHFYVKIRPALQAHVANNLQYLLGDDAGRVAFNRARIESGLAKWNKLFERSNAKMITVYRRYSSRCARSKVEMQSFRMLPSSTFAKLRQRATRRRPT
jgi:hypothetical protein